MRRGEDRGDREVRSKKGEVEREGKRGERRERDSSRNWI